MIQYIKKLYKKLDDWENEEVTINVAGFHIETNNFTILGLFLLISLLLIIKTT